MFLPMNTKPRPAGSRWHRFLRHAHGVTRTSSREHASRGYVVREIIFLSLYFFLPLLLATAPRYDQALRRRCNSIRERLLRRNRANLAQFVANPEDGKPREEDARSQRSHDVRTHESVIIRDFWLDARLRSVCARFASSESVC